MDQPRTYVIPPESVNPIARRPQDIGNARDHSTGGAPFEGSVRSVPGGLLGLVNRANPATNDSLIQRRREYIWRRAYSLPVAQAWNNPVADGPTRDMPTTRFNRNLRPLVGGSHQNMVGMHTYLPTGQQGGSQLSGRAVMRAGHQNRLTVQRYRGQSYSSTTQVLN